MTTLAYILGFAALTVSTVYLAAIVFAMWIARRDDKATR